MGNRIVTMLVIDSKNGNVSEVKLPKSRYGDEIFNKVFKNQFGYEPIHQNGKLIKEEDMSLENYKKLQLMGYIPYVILVLEKHPKPSFREVIRLRGTAKPTSCTLLGSLYNKIGFIKSEGKRMVKGDNYDRFLNTKWDWFEIDGNKVYFK